MTAVATGRAAETQALQHMKKQGCRLLARNYRAGHYEIDLVMRQGETIVFVEVRARRSTAFGTPAETVGAAKQRFLLTAAQTYLMENRLTSAPVRFDVVEVYLSENRVNHIENAFGAS